MAVENLVAFSKDQTELKKGYQKTVLHVGAVNNKLDELKAVLEPRFDQRPAFGSERFRYDITEYRLRGYMNGVEYEVSLENIGCPVPISMAQMHHASVRLREGRTDELTPLIEQEFRKYELEVNARNILRKICKQQQGNF